MIISVSRRGDIPAFGGDWFMEQLRRGAVEVRNPFRPAQETRVSLKKKDVDALVFWSRDPRPLMKHLREIDLGGYPYYFLLTATGYPRLLEPSTPRIEEAAGFFEDLAGRSGRHRVIWRYDPVIFTEQSDFDFHVHNFSRLASLFSPFTSRVIVSFFDPYPKVGKRLKKAGIEIAAAAGSLEQQSALLARFAAVAAAAGLEIQSCAEAAIAAGVRTGKCIDEGLLNELFGLRLSYRKDPSQRKLCLCQQSVDIGSYGTCRHGCLYCYAC
ncbi:MAG TPA: DUF1848 domain-containing protein [Patescibacteria group bacterium]|nr:DUF1848 domain-containing protein [Patescibacteria group bacterium]